MEEKALDYVRDNFPRYRSLFAGFLVILLFARILDDFFEKFIFNTEWRLALYSLATVIYAFLWFFEKYKFPRTRKNKTGIIICIETENNQQKVRLKNDLVKKIQKLVISNGLNSVIDVVVLNNYQAGRLCSILNNYSGILSEAKKGELLPTRKIPKEIKYWQQAEKKIRGHFFVWGSIKQRQGEYYIETEALVLHSPVNPVIHGQIEKDFLTVWYKKISFLEKVEFEGFNLTADLIYIAVKYIAGIAALVSLNPFLALKLHKDLGNDLSKIDPLPINLQQIRDKLSSLIAEESFIIAKWYHTQGNPKKTDEHLNMSFSALKENYGAYLLRAIVNFNNGHTDEALQDVEKSRQYANGDGTWRYSKAFLLMDQEQFVVAAKIYKRIGEISYTNEGLTVSEVIDFCEKYLQTKPDKIQCLYVLGFLTYKKEGNPTQAICYFDNFMEKCRGQQKYVGLEIRAKSYIQEIEKEMKLPNKRSYYAKATTINNN